MVVGRWLLVAIALLVSSLRAGAAPAVDICKGDGSSFWLLRMADWNNAVAPAAPTQAGVDALRKTEAPTVHLQSLLLNQRACPVADFSALMQIEGLTAVGDLPNECLAAFARTAKLPSLTALGVFCGEGSAIDLQQLRAYPALETVRFVFGCRYGPDGLAPLAALPRLHTLIDADGGSLAGLQALTGLTGLVIASPDATTAPLATLRALRRLEITLYQPVDLSAIGELTTLEELVITAQDGAPVDVAPLAKLTLLRRLEVYAHSIAQGAALAKLTNLCALDLSHAARGVEVAPLAALGHLRSLHLPAARGLSLAPLARLQALETLELWSGCAQPSIDLAPLAKLPRLSSVFLNGRVKATNRAPLAQKIRQEEPYCGRRRR